MRAPDGRPESAALIPGSFDPVTNGHLDVIERTTRVFDRVVVAAVANPTKTTLFSLDEREQMLAEATAGWPSVSVEAFDGLLVDFARKRGITAMVKGLRAVTDFDYELQMAQLNYRISGIETLFMPTTPQHSFLSSSLVREVARLGGEVSFMVPAHVVGRLATRMAP
ncbi:MAG: pantetheine-phosphate adenylyltransferase [Acidimicrobiales bacterium]